MALRLAATLLLTVQLPATASSTNGEAVPAAAAALRHAALGTDDACEASPVSAGGDSVGCGTCAVSALQRQSSKQADGRDQQASGLQPGVISPLEGCQGIDCVSQYIALDDSEFVWKDTGARVEGVDAQMSVPWKGYVLNVTSQRWLTEAEIDNPLWWHIVVVVVPEQIEFPDWATLNLAFGYYPDYPEGAQILTPLTRIENRYAHSRLQDGVGPSIEITADNLYSSLPELQSAAAEVAAYTAVRTKALAACIIDLPNGYEVFTSDNSHMRRSADWLKGYSYGEFLQHPDRPELIDELPVAKAVVKAMDAITAFTREQIPEAKVDRFGLVGYSKLGTAVFITAAVDERVKAIAPGAIWIDWRDAVPHPQPESSLAQLSNDRPVLDDHTFGMLTMAASYNRMYAEAGTPQWKKITAIIDPVYWLDRLAIPTLYMLAANDEILPTRTLDSARRHLKSFKGPTSFLELPNTRHDLSVVHAKPTVAAFFRGVLLNKPAPELDWHLDEASGKITAKVSSGGPAAIRAKRWAGEGLQSSGLEGSLLLATDIEETSPGSGLYESTLEAPKPSRSISDPAIGGTFLHFEFEWPEPGFNFTISTPMWLSPQE